MHRAGRRALCPDPLCHYSRPTIGDKSLAEMLIGRDDVMADLYKPKIRRLTDAISYLGLSEVMVDRVLAVAKG
jgi:hypothetical protein